MPATTSAPARRANRLTTSALLAALASADAADDISTGALTRVAFTRGAQVVPEPATLALLGGGLLGLTGMAGWRMKRGA